MKYQMNHKKGASLAALGENGLLDLLTARWKTDARKVLTGVGDDCAVLRGEGKNHHLLFQDRRGGRGRPFSAARKAGTDRAQGAGAGA